jgi:hypothetical protein
MMGVHAEDGSFAYLVSINGKIHRDLTTPIPDGDDIYFTPMGGGSLKKINFQ